MRFIDPLIPKIPARRTIATQRSVPVQPTGVPDGSIWLGMDLGVVPYVGEEPRPGDTVVVVGNQAQKVAMTGRRPPPMRDPIFRGGCRCKCGGSGLIFVMTPIWATTNLIAIQPDGVFVARFMLPEVLNGEGFAIDPDDTDTLYVLDNRTGYSNLLTDDQQQPFLNDKNYFTLHKYQLSGTEYVHQTAIVLPGADHATGDHDGEPLTDIGNPVSVLNGEMWVTRTRVGETFIGGYFRWNGGVVSQVAFDQEVESLGGIATVPDRPAPGAALFTSDLNDEVIRFGETGAITEQVEITDASRLPATVALCNRLLALHGFGTTRDEDTGNVPPEGGGGGGEEG